MLYPKKNNPVLTSFNKFKLFRKKMCMLKTFQNKKNGPVFYDTYEIMIFLNKILLFSTAANELQYIQPLQ